MSFLVDTNVVSEARKGDRMNSGVRSWLQDVADEDLYLSVLVTGEIRRGIERLRRRDEASAGRLDAWLRSLVLAHEDRILPVTAEITDIWGRLGVPDPVSVVDGLLAATALEHGLTLVTRNEADVRRTGVPTLNPFE